MKNLIFTRISPRNQGKLSGKPSDSIKSENALSKITSCEKLERSDAKTENQKNDDIKTEKRKQ